MRILLLILLVTLSWIAKAQIRIVSYTAEDRELIQVFKDLEKKYQIHFAFGVEELKGKKVTIDATDQSLSTLLETLLNPHQLEFEIVEEDFISVTHASSVLVRMTLLDNETNDPLSFATARIKGTTKGYIADVNGNFEFVLRDPTETILELSFLGYEKKEINAGSIDPTNPFFISLNRDATMLKEIIVREYLNKGITVDDEASHIAIDIQNMEILPGLSERDVLLSAQILAGISSADESAGGLNIRGSSRDNTFLYWNKIPVYQPAHYFGNISSFIPSTIGKVNIYKNYIPVSYGGSSSGLLSLNSRIPNEERPIVESNLNLTHGDLYTSVPFANYNGRFSLGLRRSFNDLLATPTFNSISDKLFEGSLTQDVQDISDNFEYNSKLIFSDFNLAIDYIPVGKNEFSFSLLRSESKLNYNSTDEENIQQSIQNHNVVSFGGNFTWKRRWVDHVSSEVSTSFADYHMNYGLVNSRDEGDGRENDLQQRNNNLKNWESRATIIYSPIKNHVFDAGYQFNSIQADLTINEDFFFEEDFTESISSDGNTHGFFSSYFGKFESGLQAGVGIRYNHYDILGKGRLDRQLRLNYQVTPSLLFKSTAGVYHQYISSLKEVDFVFSNTIEQNWITANTEEGIPIIKNEQFVLGGLFTHDGWIIDLDGYIKQVFSPVARSFGFRLDDEETVISGQEQIYGVDLTIKRRWKYYRAWVSYTFLDSEVEAADVRFTSGLNIRHQLQFSQTLNYKQFEFSLGYTVRSGLPFTVATGIEQIIPDEPNEDPFFEINYAPLNRDRLPAYQRLDASAWYKFSPTNPSGFTAEIGVSILNLLNADNLYSRSYSIEEDENEELFLLRSDRKLIGITPNISVRLKF